MNKEGYINEAEKNILHTYNRFSLVLDHGEVFICMIQTEKNIWILRQASQCRHLDTATKSMGMP